MSRAVNAIVIGIAAMIVIVGAFWFFVDFLGAQARDEDARPQATDRTQSDDPPTTTESTQDPITTTATTTFVETSATTGTSSATFTSTATFTQTQTFTKTITPSPSNNTSADVPANESAAPPNASEPTAMDGAAPPSAIAFSILQVQGSEARNAVRDFMEQASLALILGGLLMLGFVVSLVMLRAMFVPGSDVGPRFRRPDALQRATAPTPELPPGEQAGGPPPHAPDPAVRQDGRQQGRRMRARSLPDVLRNMIAAGMGEARLLHVGDDDARVRLYGCRECRGGRHARPQGCGHTVGWLEGALATFAKEPRAREVACTARGGTVCEFEVRF